MSAPRLANDEERLALGGGRLANDTGGGLSPIADRSAPTAQRPAPSAARTSPAARLFPLVAAGVVLAVGLALIDGLPVGVMHDDGMYVILSKALATGRGYRWIHVPGAPPATHFPPGYPAVLAILWKLFPTFPQNVVAFKVLNAVFLAAATAAIAVFARKRLGFGPWGAAAVATAGALAIPTLVLSTVVMSEPMFLALIVPLLMLAERIAETEPGPAAVALLGASVGAATLVRSHGVALVAALGVVLLLRRRWRDLILFGASAVAIMLPWQLWVRANEGFVPAAMRGNYESYTAWLARGIHADGIGLLFRTFDHTTHDLFGMLGVFSGTMLPVPGRIAGLAAAIVLIGAGLWRFRRAAPVSTAFLVVYFAIVLTWPFIPDRFVFGVWPFLFLVPVLGVVQLRAWRPSLAILKAFRFAILAGAAVAAFGFAAYNVRGYRRRWWSNISRYEVTMAWPLINWTLAHTSPRAVVASQVEPMLYLYTGRSTLPVISFTVEQFFREDPPEARAQALRTILGAYHVDALWIPGGNSLAIAAERMLTEHPPELVALDTLAHGMVLAPAGPLSTLHSSR